MGTQRDGLHLRGKTWWMSYILNGRRIRESSETTNRKLADAILAKKKSLIAENRYLDVKRESGVRFKDFSAEYLEKYSKPNKRSWKSADTNSIRKLDRFFGDMELSKITQEMVEEYVRSRRATVKKGKEKEGYLLAPATVNRELSCLKTIFSKAVEWKKVDVSPCAKVKKLRENNERTRYLTEAEMDKLINAASPELRPIIIVLLHTGMRKGELQGLRWADLDFDRNIITLPRTKNGKVRYIPMNKVAKQVLLQRRIAKASPEWVFPGPRKPDRPWDFVAAYRIARKQAGLTDVRIHDLRHTFASHMCMSGAGLAVVRTILGHSSVAMTERYSHLSDRHTADAVARLERLSPGLVTN